MGAKIKLYLLSGSMGSGKSSFLKNLLAFLPGEKIGIIVNEFGRIACGGTIYKKKGVSYVKSNSGSVFCSCKRASLVGAIEEMAEHPLKYLFIEVAGIADLASFCDIINEVPAPGREVLEYSGVIYIVDGLYFLDQMENIGVIESQLQHSNLAVINKIDLIGKKTIEKIKSKILEVNPGIIIKEAQFGRFDYSFLNEDLIEGQSPACEDATDYLESTPVNIILSFEGELKKEELTRFLKEVSKACYRIKGYFKLDDGWNRVDVVDSRIDYKPLTLTDRASVLMIVSKIGNAAVEVVQDSWERTIGKKMRISE